MSNMLALRFNLYHFADKYPGLFVMHAGRQFPTSIQQRKCILCLLHHLGMPVSIGQRRTEHEAVLKRVLAGIRDLPASPFNSRWFEVSISSVVGNRQENHHFPRGGRLFAMLNLIDQL
jgi:hypothetical protein